MLLPASLLIAVIVRFYGVDKFYVLVYNNVKVCILSVLLIATI